MKSFKNLPETDKPLLIKDGDEYFVAKLVKEDENNEYFLRSLFTGNIMDYYNWMEWVYIDELNLDLN